MGVCEPLCRKICYFLVLKGCSELVVIWSNAEMFYGQYEIFPTGMNCRSKYYVICI